MVSSSQSGFGDYSSFLELLIDLKLEGKDIPSGEEVFNNIKKQINHAQGLIFHASKEYKKLENKTVVVEDFGDKAKALLIVQEAIEYYKECFEGKK